MFRYPATFLCVRHNHSSYSSSSRSYFDVTYEYACFRTLSWIQLFVTFWELDVWGSIFGEQGISSWSYFCTTLRPSDLMCTGDERETNRWPWSSAKINIIIRTYLHIFSPPLRPLLRRFACVFCGMIMNVFILFSPQNVTMFYAHFGIFKLKLDLQYRYARAQLTVKGLGAECRNSSRNVGVTSLKIREYSETAVERNTFSVGMNWTTRKFGQRYSNLLSLIC